MMKKWGEREWIAAFGILLLWTANSLIILPLSIVCAASQSVSNEETTFEHEATSSSVSEPLPTILNEPTYFTNVGRPEPVKGSSHRSGTENGSLPSLRNDPSEKDLFDPNDSDDINADRVEKESPSDCEISDGCDPLQDQNIQIARDMVSTPDDNDTIVEAETAVDSSIPYPSIRSNAEVQKEFDHYQIDVDEEVSQVTTIDEDFDDRSLLDVFGEVAKEYLTQQVIPPTDADCRWDWRSFRCESSCRCRFQWKRGDYHLGRACRRRIHDLAYCPPTVFVIDRPIPKRLVSLLQQTSDILRTKIQRVLDKIQSSITYHIRMVQNRLCLDLWSYLYEAVDGTQCWLWIPTSTTILERMFCGRNMHHIPPCREDILSSSQRNRLPSATNEHLNRRFRNRQFHPKKNVLTGFYENEIV